MRFGRFTLDKDAQRQDAEVTQSRTADDHTFGRRAVNLANITFRNLQEGRTPAESQQNLQDSFRLYFADTK